MDRACCLWEVTAGFLPHEPIPAHTQTFYLTVEDWADGAGYRRFLKREGQATAYVRLLQERCAHGDLLHWVRLDFFWF